MNKNRAMIHDADIHVFGDTEINFDVLHRFSHKINRV